MSEAYFRRIKSKYGLSKEDLLRLVVKQGSRCATCSRELVLLSSDRREVPHVDHCHAAEVDGRMVVRGLLCGACNTTAGFIEKDLDRCAKVMAYIAQRSRPAIDPNARIQPAKAKIKRAKAGLEQLRRQGRAGNSHYYQILGQLDDLAAAAEKVLDRPARACNTYKTLEDKASDGNVQGK